MPSLAATATVSSLLRSSTRMISSTSPLGMSLYVSSSVPAALYAGSTTTSFLLSIMAAFYRFARTFHGPAARVNCSHAPQDHRRQPWRGRQGTRRDHQPGRPVREVVARGVGRRLV